MNPISQWRYTSDERKTELLSRYDKLTNADADLMGTTLDNLKRQLRRFRQKKPVPAPVTTAHNHSFPAIVIPPPDDTAQFNDRLKAITHDYVRVMHLCDIHFPYQHNPSLDLAVQLVGYTQPHVVVIGSDEFDFMRLGSFDVDQRLASPELDDLDLIRKYHYDFVDRLIDVSPYTLYVWIFGNHDYRLYRHLLKNSPNIAKTVMRDFAELVRYQGRILYLGETDQVKIHNLIVAHGTRAGVNPAKQHFEIVGGQINYMAGHVHRRSFWQRQGYYAGMASVTSGCLCQLQPHYTSYRADKTAWENGTAIAEIRANSDRAGALFENLKFEDDDSGGLSVRHHNLTFTAKI